MPNDTFHGADCELRVGLMADATTDPTAWFNLEFLRFSVSPSRERNERPKLGVARHNALDPIKPTNGFFRYGAELVVDADTRQLPRWLRLAFGAPTTGALSGGVYPHVWASGSKTPTYFALQIRTASGKVRVFRGLTGASISASGSGEQVENYDITISLRGLKRARVADWLTGAVTAVPSAAPASRAQFKMDGVAASNTLSASWSWDRQLAEDVFMSSTAEVSGLRPNGGTHSGQASFRAVGDVFDDMEEGDTVFAAALAMSGVVSAHEITFEHSQAMLSAPALEVGGPGQIERSIAWTGHQTNAAAASKITVKNEVASYAS